MVKKIMHGLLLGTAATALSLVLWFAGALDSWEYTTWSWRVRQAAEPSRASDDIKIILLDQESLDWGKEVNGWSWPWPREVYGPLIDFCRRGGARSVAFDVLYTEPSVYGVWDDEALGMAMAGHEGFVGAIFLPNRRAAADTTASAPEIAATWGPGQQPWACDGLAAWLDQQRPDMLFSGDPTVPIPEVAGNAALANVSDIPDADGVFRRASLLRIHDGHPVPSLGLASFLIAQTGAEPAWRLEAERLHAGAHSVPIDPACRAILRFIGPTGTHETFNAAAIIQSELRLLAGEDPVVDPATFAGKHVFFGFSAPGLLDLRPTPLSRVTPGVEIHATALDNLLSDRFLREAPQSAAAAVTLLLAIGAGIVIVMGRKARHNVAAFVILLPMPAVIGLLAYGPGFWWPVVVGELAVGMALIGGVVLNYATEGRQRRFIKGAFKHYLSPHVIERIIDDPDQLQLGGERRELTILFSDLEGFTAISEGLDPQALTILLNDYLSDMTDIILDEGGTLDKYEGDAIIAFWNAPLSQPDHARRACRAACRAQQQLAARRAEFEKRAGALLRMRIGMHTGDVIVGNMGSRQRFDYTVLGDAANLASRLEGANKVFGTYTMISESTYRAAGDTIVSREMGRLRVVGRREPVRVYELTGLTADGVPGVPANAQDFTSGLAHCYEGRLDDAVAIFAALPDDPVARAYTERCRRVLADAQADFTGTWNLTSK